MGVWLDGDVGCTDACSVIRHLQKSVVCNAVKVNI